MERSRNMSTIATEAAPRAGAASAAIEDDEQSHKLKKELYISLLSLLELRLVWGTKDLKEILPEVLALPLKDSGAPHEFVPLNGMNCRSALNLTTRTVCF